MAIHIPERNYYTFSELEKRWDCSNNDLSFAIISEALKPSIRLNTVVFEQEWVRDDYGHFFTRDFRTADGKLIGIRPDGWFYLQMPIQTHPFDCEFRLVSDDRDAQKEGWTDFPTMWFKLREHRSLDDIRRDGVFLNGEVARYEALHGLSNSKPERSDNMGSRQRGTILKLVIGMAIRGYGYDAAALRSDVPNEISSDLAALDIHVTDETVRKYLKEAAEFVLPRKK